MNLRQETAPKSEVELYCRRHLLSLEEMSLLRITTVLCNNRQLMQLILKCKLQENYRDILYTRRSPEWAAVQKMANKLVSQMCKGKKFFEMIMEYVWSVSYRMMRWKSVYAPSIGNQFIRHFYWTDQGRIDNPRTAKHIIGNKNISIKKRFVLACSVCLSQEIQDIWQELSIHSKIYFIEDRSERLWPLVSYWAENMTGLEMPDTVGEDEDDDREIFNNACTCAFDNGLINALKYLFAISAEAERNERATVCTHRFYNRINFHFNPEGKINYYNPDGEMIYPVADLKYGFFLEADHLDMLYFLFFEMNRENRYSCSSLLSVKFTLLLHFSEPRYFLNGIEEVLSRSGWVSLLLYFLFFNYHLEITKNDDYRKSFFHIWRKIPESMRKKYANSYMGEQFLAILIRDNFPFILRKDSFKKLSELTSLDWNPRSSGAPFGFHRGKWEFLHFLVQEGMVKIPLLKRLNLDTKCDLKIRKSNKAAWNRFLRFVRKIECSNRQ